MYESESVLRKIAVHPIGLLIAGFRCSCLGIESHGGSGTTCKINAARLKEGLGHDNLLSKITRLSAGKNCTSERISGLPMLKFGAEMHRGQRKPPARGCRCSDAAAHNTKICIF